MPTSTPTPTNTPPGPTATPTRTATPTNTPIGPTSTPTLTPTPAAPPAYDETYAYDAIGNLTSKPGVGVYGYGSNSNGTGAGPHQARTVNGTTYSYKVIAGGNVTQTRKNYTGQELDTTGLLYYNARYYDPNLSRLLSADSVVPGSASGEMDGVALKGLTVDFHEPRFVGGLNGENTQAFWFQLTDEQRKDAGSPTPTIRRTWTGDTRRPCSKRRDWRVEIGARPSISTRRSLLSKKVILYTYSPPVKRRCAALLKLPATSRYDSSIIARIPSSAMLPSSVTVFQCCLLRW